MANNFIGVVGKRMEESGIEDLSLDYMAVLLQERSLTVLIITEHGMHTNLLLKPCP